MRSSCVRVWEKPVGGGRFLCVKGSFSESPIEQFLGGEEAVARLPVVWTKQMNVKYKTDVCTKAVDSAFQWHQFPRLFCSSQFLNNNLSFRLFPAKQFLEECNFANGCGKFLRKMSSKCEPPRLCLSHLDYVSTIKSLVQKKLLAPPAPMPQRNWTHKGHRRVCDDRVCLQVKSTGFVLICCGAMVHWYGTLNDGRRRVRGGRALWYCDTAALLPRCVNSPTVRHFRHWAHYALSSASLAFACFEAGTRFSQVTVKQVSGLEFGKSPLRHQCSIVSESDFLCHCQLLFEAALLYVEQSVDRAPETTRSIRQKQKRLVPLPLHSAISLWIHLSLR